MGEKLQCDMEMDNPHVPYKVNFHGLRSLKPQKP